MMMAQSLFLSLKQSYPDCLIDVLAPAWSLPLLHRMPQVANAIAMPLGHGQFGLMARIKLGRELRSKNYDRAIVLPNSWKSAVVPFFARIPKRTGFVGECRWGLLNDARKLDKGALTMTVQRFVALGLPKHAPQPPDYPNPSIPADIPSQNAAIQKFNLHVKGKILALCPGAEYGPSKRWPAAYFADVAQAKIQQGWQVWLLGSEKDRAAAERINKLTNQQCRDFIGQTTLTEAVDLLSLADTVIANDSGLMHLAAARDKQLIALYGSSDPGFTPPLNAKAQVISLNLDCAPCFKRECPLFPPSHPDHTQCLTKIKPERILELIGD
jgi:heptosyltransferase II